MSRAEADQLREYCRKLLKPWASITWHESHDTGVGTPDLSFNFREPGYETGWCELKATNKSGGKADLSLRPAQHQWIETHYRWVPVIIFVRFGDWKFAVDPAKHSILSAPIKFEELFDISKAHFAPVPIDGSHVLNFFKLETQRVRRI